MVIGRPLLTTGEHGLHDFLDAILTHTYYLRSNEMIKMIFVFGKLSFL
jgi:hypothetical protein